LAERLAGFKDYFERSQLRLRFLNWTTAVHHKGALDRGAELQDMEPAEVALVRQAEKARDELTRISSSNQPWGPKRNKATEEVRRTLQALTEYRSRKSLK
jgi:hypothetical protein